MAGGVAVGLVLIGAGGLLVGLAGRIDAGRLGRNRWAGLRIPATTANDEAWRAGQLATVPSLRIAGGCYLVAGLAAVANELLHGPELVLPALAFAVVVVTAVLAVVQIRVGGAAARRAGGGRRG